MKRKFGDVVVDTVVPYMVATLYALLILVPIFFVFVSSFKQNAEIFSRPLDFPVKWDLTNYSKLLSPKFKFNFGIAIENSIIITVGAELLTIILAFPAAYAIARVKTRFSPVFETIFGFGFLIPTFTIMLPTFLLMANLGILYSRVSLILFYPAARLPISVMIMASFLRQISSEIENSAILDGANTFQRIIYIFLPLSAPGIVTVIILNFIFIWNEFFLALILLNTQNRTIQIALSTLRSIQKIDYGMMAAGILLSVLPVLVLFVIFQEKIVQGMMAGAIKE